MSGGVARVPAAALFYKMNWRDNNERFFKIM
jgi:hypothetical protein